MAAQPIEGQVLLLTAAKASVPSNRLPALVERAQDLLWGELERYRREYEQVAVRSESHGPTALEAFLVEWGHWEAIGGRAGFDSRERSAVRRAHEEQFLRIGRRTGREAEFETALEIREPVLIGVGGGSDRGDG
ncbi:hypothetical protein [Natronobacterium gregoryi]|uniref:DUF8048 domain-containing protein n=2 Tax=Natronobacterium gregoryi TaxID=44930 RepID=L0AGL9_NATGS|nr:hypothetical protein [Natronobacterium gregoryi]AFZ72297.1 hypothetical protein Natgr_1067 [Natronobacterium gregoryi SP2]ELY62428.1 hypothetical protein C490_18123 [Natronobacterium gregoryi SP2]PLK18473.1 hypothetical protein CYV19_17735 [Natronobacterium gregoryi SP2]SFJ69870.1 hypothetical protein SAMN05443661_1607 [Natronobacterium gregoryi]